MFFSFLSSNKKTQFIFIKLFQQQMNLSAFIHDNFHDFQSKKSI